jgi:hypothetical protein
MPQVLTKHPDIVLRVLQSAPKVRCGKEVQRKILKNCPGDRFCALPRGEICVYGLADVDQMSQFSCDNVVKHSRKCSLCGKKGHNRNNQQHHPYTKKKGGKRKTKRKHKRRGTRK